MEIYESHKMENPRLPFIFHSYTYQKGESLGFGNWHENVELLCVTEGCAKVRINGQSHALQKDEIAVINAHELHDILADEDMHFYCLIVDRSFCLSNHFDPSRLHFETLVRDREIVSLIHTLAEEYGNDSLPYRVQFLRSTVLRIMALLCERYSREETESLADTALFSAIKKTLGYIHAESHRKLTLDRLSEVAGLSKYYLAREFHRITGCTVVSYINHVRCENAKRMMMESKLSILAISRACGFTNASYFTRIFSSVVGMRPVEYRSALVNMENDC